MIDRRRLPGSYRLRGARVWDGVDGESRAADVHVVEGRIAEIGELGRAPDGTVDIDLSSCVIIPGLIDCHVHLVWDGSPDPVRTLVDGGEHLALLRAARHCEDHLHGGVTTVRDLGSSWDAAISVAKAVEDGTIYGARVLPAGRAIIMTGGHDPFWGFVADGPEAVRAAVRRQWSLGARVIKMAATGGAYGRSEGEAIGQEELRPEELQSGIEEAHRLGLRVAVHAVGREGIGNAVLAGVDTVEHGTFLSEDIAVEMAARGTALCPTLLVYQTIAGGSVGIPAYATQKASAVVAAQQTCMQLALAHGIRVIAGTDAGSCGTGHPSLLGELEALVAAGLTRHQALRAATSEAAAAVAPGTGLGTLLPGSPADLVVLRGDPLDDLGRLREVRLVVKDGAVASLPDPPATLDGYCDLHKQVITTSLGG